MEEDKHHFLRQFSPQNQKKITSSVTPQEDAQWTSEKLLTAGLYKQNIW